jgi:electron transport complex protein RnfB
VLRYLLIAVAVCVVVVILGVPLLRSRSRTPEPPSPLSVAVLSVLPGANCGACGNASCFDAAEAVARGRAPSTVCSTGGPVTAAAVAAVLRQRTFKQVG